MCTNHCRVITAACRYPLSLTYSPCPQTHTEAVVTKSNTRHISYYTLKIVQSGYQIEYEYSNQAVNWIENEFDSLEKLCIGKLHVFIYFLSAVLATDVFAVYFSVFTNKKYIHLITVTMKLWTFHIWHKSHCSCSFGQVCKKIFLTRKQKIAVTVICTEFHNWSRTRMVAVPLGQGCKTFS